MRAAMAGEQHIQLPLAGASGSPYRLRVGVCQSANISALVLGVGCLISGLDSVYICHGDISFPGLCPCQMVDYLDLRTTSARTANGNQMISNKIDSNPAPPQQRQNRRAVVCLVYLAYSSGWSALRALESSRDDVTGL